MQLKSVQAEAIKRANLRPGFAFFMEQGLGKTLTVLSEFQDAVNEGLATRLVVVCPNSFKEGWRAEIQEHGFDFEVFIWEGSEDPIRRHLRKGFTRPPVLIINYEAIRYADAKKRTPGRGFSMIREFIGNKPAYIAFDESIQLKTHDSNQTKAAIDFSKEFAIRRILSGKPQTQGPHDLWGQFRAIGELNGFNYFSWKTTFCKMGGWQMKQVTGAQNQAYLENLIQPFVFRATKKDWTDLPDKTYGIRQFKMTPKMQDLYSSMEHEFMVWLKNGENVTVDAAITKYIKLSQIQCGFVIKEDGTTEWLVDDKDNPRLNLLADIIETEVEGKIIVPYVNKPVFDSLMRRFEKLNPAFIRGSMTPDEIADNKLRFNTDKDCRIIFLQMRAAKYGHTLLGEQSKPENACRTMWFYQNTYSLDDRAQIEDRNHRHGQTFDCFYGDLCGSALDRGAIKALQSKEDMFQSVFKNLT